MEIFARSFPSWSTNALATRTSLKSSRTWMTRAQLRSSKRKWKSITETSQDTRDVGIATFTVPTDSSTSGGTPPRKPLPCSGEVSPKDSTPPHFHLYPHALTACSAQKLAAVVLEEELDATSLVLRACSTLPPVGLETPAAVFGVVGASST